MVHINSLLKSSKFNLKKEIKNQNKNKLSDGCFVYELEADTTIPSEYILLMHYLGEIDLKLQEKIKRYLLEKQDKLGGWPLFHDGEPNLSTSVKAYYALKLAGQKETSNEMKKAKDLIIKMGGAEKTNVFTKISLALFGQISWDSIPYMPIEIINFPKWFPFNIYKISYWSRTVLIPLLIIMQRRPQANNPNVVSIDEIFKNKDYKISIEIGNKDEKLFSNLFLFIDKILRLIFPLVPKKYKNGCIEKSYEWILKRLNGEDGLGGIFPAMVNSLIALDIDKKNRFSKEVKIVKNAINRLIVEKKNTAYCQPCVSPVWDSGWMGHVMLENDDNVDKLANWFLKKEIKTNGDWLERKKFKPGGWAFQFNNSYYPDVDDTALVGMFLDRYYKKNKSKKILDCIERTRSWIIGMQSSNGGWGAFDIDNNKQYLNSIPFADHGALLDPPTVDVSARCISFLKQLNKPEDIEVIKKGLEYILSNQEKDGSWFGRWGTNYIYGTWSSLCALNLLDFKNKSEVFKKAVNFLKSSQRNDGGWGEDGVTYFKNSKNISKKSTPSQTAWAIMGLTAAGEIDSPEVEKGIKYLLKNKKDCDWAEDYFTAVGFPKVFYLKYHGYAQYFPLLAILKIKNQLKLNSSTPQHGV